MTGREFITTALTLASGNDEPAWRSATSRAYYAAFNHCKYVLTNKLGCVFFNDSSDHPRVRDKLRACGTTDLKKAAIILDNLRMSRNHADYLKHPHLFRSVKVANLDIARAQNVIAKVDEIINDPGVRKQAKANLRKAP